MTRSTRSILFAALTGIAVAAASAPAIAHDVKNKAEFDKLMGSREKYYQPVDKTAPGFTLRDMEGNTVRLADLRGKVVVLHFNFASCTAVCPLHATRIAEIQAMINSTPMKALVRFVTITTDPAKDTLPVLRKYGMDQGLDPVNWSFLTTRPGQPEDTTRKLAARFGHKFSVTDGTQVHGVVTHLIDSDGHWVGNFHGLKFDPVNLVLFVNQLTNQYGHAARQTERGFWTRLLDAFGL